MDGWRMRKSGEAHLPGHPIEKDARRGFGIMPARSRIFHCHAFIGATDFAGLASNTITAHPRSVHHEFPSPPC